MDKSQELRAFGEQAISGDRKENKKVIAALLQSNKSLAEGACQCRENKRRLSAEYRRSGEK